MNLLRIFLFSFFMIGTVSSATEEKKEVTFGGFLDAYYGFDFTEPTGDRSFTTQAIRHNEFSVNLVYVDVRLLRPKVRGRLALQTGSSVYANYSGERRYGPATGPQLADAMRHIQEAYGGYRLADGLWIEGGIFLSHIGAETFISKENWNYTRSLAADFSPYYQAGIRVSYQWSPVWSSQLHLMNGWQNIIETNGDKAIGMQVSYTPSEDFSVTYNNFIGREKEFRFFNDFILKFNLSNRWSVVLNSDVGFQKMSGSGGYSTWYAETLLTQYRLTDTVALGGRIEYFNDKDQVIVTTSTPDGFQTVGGSLNLDWQPDTYLLVRNEIRSLFSKNAVFSGRAGAESSNTLFVSSLALSF